MQVTVLAVCEGRCSVLANNGIIHAIDDVLIPPKKELITATKLLVVSNDVE